MKHWCVHRKRRYGEMSIRMSVGDILIKLILVGIVSSSEHNSQIVRAA